MLCYICRLQQKYHIQINAGNEFQVTCSSVNDDEDELYVMRRQTVQDWETMINVGVDNAW